MITNKKAVSMVEVMIGVILLALLVLPSLNVITSQGRAVTATRDHTAAAYLAQKIQELARSFQFSLISDAKYKNLPEKQKTTFEWLINNSESYKKHIINGIEYEIQDAVIKPLAFSGDKNNDNPLVYGFSFTIFYIGKDKREHTLSIYTAISKRD